MDGLTSESLRAMDSNALYEALRGHEAARGAVQDEIVRREMESLPEGVAETLAYLAERERLDLASSKPARVVFTVTTDYDDGPAWDADATVFMRDGQNLSVDFGRTGVGDSLNELSEHARPSVGDVLVVNLDARTAEVLRG